MSYDTRLKFLYEQRDEINDDMRKVAIPHEQRALDPEERARLKDLTDKLEEINETIRLIERARQLVLFPAEEKDSTAIRNSFGLK